MKATTIVNNADYTSLVLEMKTRGLWTQDLDDLDAKMRSYALDML